MRKKIVTYFGAPILTRALALVVVLLGAAVAVPSRVALAQTPTKAPAGDICSIRPDLCDEPVESAPVSKSQNFNAQPAARCRMPGASTALAQKNLPVCQVQGTHRGTTAASSAPAHNSQDVLWDDPAPVVRRVARTPASATASVSFAEYMNANAAHPALNAKIKDHQKAFIETAAPAVILFPTGDSSTREDTTSVVINAPPAGANPGGATPGTPGVDLGGASSNFPKQR